MRNQAAQKFSKGINARLPIDRFDDPTRLYRLQNARLTSRGETFYVKRIEGAVPVGEGYYPICLDVKNFKNFTVILYKNFSDSENHYIDVVNNVKPEEKPLTIPFSYRGENTFDVGKLIVLEDTILVSPHNKQLNYINGVWRLNDFVSTTPLINADPQITAENPEQQEAGFAEGFIRVFSSVQNTTTPGSRARIYIAISPVVDGNTVGFSIGNIELDGSSVIGGTPIFFENPSDYGSISNVAGIIVNRLSSHPTFQSNGKWTAIVSGDGVLIEANSNNIGSALNNKILKIINVQPDSNSAPNLALVQTFFNVGETGSLEGNTSGGVDPNRYAGITVEFGTKKFITEDFAPGELASSVLQKLLTGFTTVLSVQDYNIVIINDRVNIKAKIPGTRFNLPAFTVTNPPLVALEVNVVDGGTDITGGDLEVGKTVWYTGRNVYRDGHRTKTSFPVKFLPEEFSNKASLTITPALDLDGTYADVEIFRKIGPSDFFFIKKITPQTTDEEGENYVFGGTKSFKFINVTDLIPEEPVTYVFKLAEFETPEVTFFPEDTKEDFLQKIYDAFFLLDGFTIDWDIELAENVTISSKVGSSEFNDVNIEVTGDTRQAVSGTNVAVTSNTGVQTTNLIQVSETLVNLYPNDILRLQKDDTSVLVTVTDLTLLGAVNIPISEPVEVSPGSTLTFVSGEYFSRFGFIENVLGEDPYMKFTDPGLVELYALDEKDYIWSDTHKTHEIVRDRYVRANLKYESRELGVENGLFTVDEKPADPGENTSPFYANTILYAQGRYKDGTTSFFEEIGRYETLTESETLSITQDTITNEDVKEYAFYAKYTPKRSPFAEAPGFGFANINIPTELTSKYKVGVDNKLDYVRQPFAPVNPRIFIGFSRLNVQHISDSSLFYSFSAPVGSVYEWQLKEETPQGAFLFTVPTTDVTPNFPQVWDIDFGGVPVRYIKDTSEGVSASYIMLSYVGLKNLIGKVDLFYQITDFNAANGKSFGGVSKENIKSVRLQITDFTVVKHPESTSPDGAVFITLESGSVLDKVTASIAKPIAQIGTSGVNKDTNAFNVKIGTNSILDLYEWDVSGGPRIAGRIVGMAFGEGTTIFGIDQKVDLLVYMGRKDNKIETEQTRLLSGYDTEYIEERFTDAGVGIYYSSLRADNIYASLFLESDVPYLKENYPNQIIWSEPFVLQSSANGHRNFVSTSFLNIAPDYGDIVGMEYVENKLIVFCEHGVAVVNVGEVLTTQVGGEVFVDTSTFLNGYFWALKALPRVMPKSIVQYENTVFFCDGVDVWMYDGSFKNISEGAIYLRGMGFNDGQVGDADGGVGPGEGTGQQPGQGPGTGPNTGNTSGVFMGSEDWYWGSDNNYMGQDSTSTGTNTDEDTDPTPDGGDEDEDGGTTDPNEGSGPGTTGVGEWVGSMDPFNKEYRITDNYVTFAFSVEVQEWFGPYTYRDQGSDFYRNRMLSVMDARLVEHNIGRTFNGFEYEMIVESVGNVMDTPDIVKLWRKFYIDISIDGKSPDQYNPNRPGGSGNGIYMGSEDYYWGEEGQYMGEDGSGTNGGGEDTEPPIDGPNTLGVNRAFFAYRKQHFLSFKEVDLGLAKVRNNRYNIGVVNAHQNSEQLYWRIRSKEPLFVIKLVAFEFFPRKRR